MHSPRCALFTTYTICDITDLLTRTVICFKYNYILNSARETLSNHWNALSKSMFMEKNKKISKSHNEQI